MADLRILVANDLYGPSSAAGVAAAGARALAARGHEVHFLATVQERSAAGSFVEPSGMTVHQVFTPAYDLRWRAWRSLWNPAALRALAAVLARVAPQVVHFHNLHIHLSYRALKVAHDRGAPVLLTVHDVMPFCFQKMFCFVSEDLRPGGPPIPFKASPWRCARCARLRWNPLRNAWIRRHVRRHVARLLAVSPEMRRALLENGFPDAEVLENGIAAPAASADGGGFRARHGLAGRKVVLYGGRLDQRKGAEHLLRAMAVVRQRVPQAALLVVGASHAGYEERMRELACELGLADSLAVTGWLDQEELAEAYAAADVVCTPSLIFESFGLINAEGMARGKPVVTSFFGGPQDVVEDGVSGFHVNPLCVDELAGRLAELLESDELRARMGEAARQRARERFSIERQAERTEALYREVLAGGAHGR